MNFSGNITQIMIILFIALLVFGPKKMMQYAYQAGKWIAQLRKMYEQTMQQVQAEMEQAGMGEAVELLNKRVDIASEAEKFLNLRTAETPSEVGIPAPNLATAPSAAAASNTVAVSNAGATNTPSTPDATPRPSEPPPEAGRYNAWLPD